MWRDWLSSARSDEDEGESAEVRQIRRRRWRKWCWLGGGLAVLLGVGGIATYHFGGRWLEARTRSNLRRYLEQQDYRRAQLTLEQAVQVSPRSVVARRALAEFYEAAGSPLAVELWREVMALAPGDDEVRLKLAANALRIEGAAPARTVLDEVSPAGRTTLAYLRVAAGVALAEGNAGQLQQHLTAMAVLEPENARTKISLASLQLRSPDPAVAAAARTELENIARGEKLRIHATLALLIALSREEDDAAARSLAANILPKGAATLRVSPAFALLEYMKAEPHPSAEDMAALAEWMVWHGYAREALFWLATQNAAKANAAPVLAVRATAATLLRDWNLLRQLVAQGAWGRVSRDAVELAFAARLQRESAGTANAKETFDDAIELASPSLTTLQALDRLCGLWGWSEESERVLLRIVRDFPRERSAWLALLAKAEAAGKSARYWDIARRQAQAFPDDPRVQALRTYAAVITGQADSDARKAALAALAREEALVEELAAGLLLRWREKTALDTLALLTPRQIETLGRSAKGTLVYGALLGAAGKDATQILARVSRTALLPEEADLLARVAPAAVPSSTPSEKGKAR